MLTENLLSNGSVSRSPSAILFRKMKNLSPLKLLRTMNSLSGALLLMLLRKCKSDTVKLISRVISKNKSTVKQFNVSSAIFNLRSLGEVDQQFLIYEALAK